MTHHFRRFLVACLVAVPRCLAAQDTTTATPPPPVAPPADLVRCGFCHHPNVPLAIFEGLIVDGVVNRFNAWVIHDSTSYVTPQSWRYNLTHAWVWDTDDFVVNMLGHPYSGSAYFATARTNGMTFWASAPLTFFHSAVWEYFGETTRPSINDILNTGFGGIALGEMFHRVAATIRDNQADGGGRVLREVAALPFDPVGTINRLFRGEWTKLGPNPGEHNPVGTVLRMGGGAGIVRAPNASITDFKGAELSSILFADVKYGDSYVDTLRKPFDAFSMQLLVAPAHGGLTELVGVGRIAGTELGGDENHRRQLEFNQRFEYVNNGALQFGAQTLQVGVSMRTHLAGAYWLRTLAAADAIVLAGINGPGAGTGGRNYDFGPGIGATLSADFEHNTIPYIAVQYQPAYTHTISGAAADHVTAFTTLEGTIPIIDQLSLVIRSSYYSRISRYADGTQNSRGFPELRVFAAVKSAHRAPTAQ